MVVSTTGEASILPDDDIRQGALSCEDEPIRTPGSVQRHGFLLLLDDRGERVVAASQNTEEFLKVPLGLVIGTPAETILEREVLGAIRALANSTDDEEPLSYLGSFQMRGRFFSVVTHCLNGERVLEFELTDRLISPEMTNQVFTNFINRLNHLRSEAELCRALTEQFGNLTGFNRVLLYRFDEAGHGTVLCEQTDGTLPSYLDLRFPASDIPQQARDLYVLNTVRIIPDASYVPAPLHGLDQRPMGALDLSKSILPSLQYIWNTCKTWGRCLRCRSRSSAKESFGDSLVVITPNRVRCLTWCAAPAIC